MYMKHSMNCVLTQPVLENYTPPAPITAPIMAPLGADPQAQPVSSGAPQAMVQGQHGAQGPYSGMHQQQFAPPAGNQVMPNTSVEGAPGAPTGDVIQVVNSDHLLICKHTNSFMAHLQSNVMLLIKPIWLSCHHELV